MITRKGLPGGQYKPLAGEDIIKIHETSLRIFSEVGIQVNFPEALELFKQAGANVDDSTKVAKFDPDLVTKLIKSAPAVVRLYGRADNGELDCEIGGSNVYMGTGGTALNVQDPGSTDARRSKLEDIVSMARLVEALDNIHFYMLNVFPNELPVENVDVNRFGAALNNTRKHIMGGVYTVEGVRNVIRMAEIIAGSSEKLRQRPFISMVACNISPFKLDQSYGQLAMEVAKHGIPVVVPAEP
ncbi:MAG: trimethylamine methyltransferase family protein, partial [Deltaproteobacteria bacterium]|nr:trimethylamine methyltransferase family protein [Deltaproteobacteria bacterium]